MDEIFCIIIRIKKRALDGGITCPLHIFQPIRLHKLMITINFWTWILLCFDRHPCFSLCTLSELDEEIKQNFRKNGQKKCQKCVSVDIALNLAI